MSAWMPAPPPESEPAMMRTRPFTRGLSWRGSHPYPNAPPSRGRGTLCLETAPPGSGAGGARDRRRHVVDDLADELLVLAFRHHADQRLGARFAHQQPPGLAEPRLAVGDRGAHGTGFERCATV